MQVLLFCQTKKFLSIKAANFQDFPDVTLVQPWDFTKCLNGPNKTKLKTFVEKSLDRHFGSRQKLRFKSGSTKFFCKQTWTKPRAVLKYGCG